MRLRYWIFLALPFTVSFEPVAAQSVPNQNELHGAYVFNSKEKLSGTLPRLIAKTFYGASGHSLVPVDSMVTDYPDATSLLVSERTDYHYNAGSWNRFTKYTYTYDGTGFNTQTLLQYWVNGSFINLGRYNYMSNSAGVVTDMLYEVYDKPTASFINGISETYTLDVYGNVTGSLQQIWNKAAAAWGNSLLKTISYNTQNRALDEIDQTWDPTLSIWKNYSRITCVYDLSGVNLVSRVNFTWDISNSAWEYSLHPGIIACICLFIRINGGFIKNQIGGAICYPTFVLRPGLCFRMGPEIQH